MSWKVTKIKFYVFSVGNIALLLFMSVSSVDVYIFENIIMSDVITVVVILLQYFYFNGQYK